jgi:hypothetical protein
MRTRRSTFGLFAALTCISAFVSCKQQLANYSFKSDRLVSIAVSPDDARKCDVDFPVSFMRMRNNAKIGWASDDNAYTVHFVSYPGGPSPENPFNPTVNDIQVPAGGKSALQKLQNSGSGAYYKYEIHDANNSVCKTADDERDTGLNVKR